MSKLSDSKAVRKARELKMAAIIRNACTDTPGVSDMQRQVSVHEEENGYIIDVYLVVEYGCRIPEVAWDVQESVKKRLTEQMSLEVSAVNITVQGVTYPNDIKVK